MGTCLFPAQGNPWQAVLVQLPAIPFYHLQGSAETACDTQLTVLFMTWENHPEAWSSKGRVKQNFDPAPSLLSTHILPPWV